MTKSEIRMTQKPLSAPREGVFRFRLRLGRVASEFLEIRHWEILQSIDLRHLTFISKVSHRKYRRTNSLFYRAGLSPGKWMGRVPLSVLPFICRRKSFMILAFRLFTAR